MTEIEFKPPQVQEKRRSWLGILVAIVCCAAVYGALTFLTLGFFGPVLIVGGVIFGIVLFHYFVWGWWLGKLVRDASEDDEPS